MRRANMTVRDGMSVCDCFKCILHLHKYSFKPCNCVLFNYIFQNFRVELVKELTEMDNLLRRLWYSKRNV
jgi:hypothetical protein